MWLVAAEGKTVTLAYHDLEEADADADRIVLLARARSSWTGRRTEIKAKVSGRTIRATLLDAERGAAPRPPGLINVRVDGELRDPRRCADSD